VRVNSSTNKGTLSVRSAICVKRAPGMRSTPVRSDIIAATCRFMSRFRPISV
jgi:hypothetical protein